MADSPPYDQLQDEWHDLVSHISSDHLVSPGRSFVHDPARMIRPAILFAELEDNKAQWDEFLKMIVLNDYSEHFITPNWTVKDMVAHMASWAAEVCHQVKVIIGGEALDYAIPYALSVIGPNQWNQVEIEKRRRRSLDKVLRELEDETVSLQDIVLELPEESLNSDRLFALAPNGDTSTRWKGSISQIVLLKCSHERHHLERFRQWRVSVQLAEPKSPTRRSRR
jgi:hypothetical protein